MSPKNSAPEPGKRAEWLVVSEEAAEAIAQPGDHESGFETLAYTPPKDRIDPTIIDADDFFDGVSDPRVLAQNRRILDWMKRGAPIDENPWKESQ